MSLEQCTFSQESAVDYSLTSFSDTNQLSLLSGILTHAESSESDQQKDGSQDCTCGKEMYSCLIHPSTPEAWIASMQDSLARTLALLENKQAYLREPDQVFTEKCCGLLTQYDPSSSTWKTLQQSFLTDSEPFLETWPRWGMTQGGAAYAHPMSERRITETDGSCWQTPTVSCAEHYGQVKHKKGQQLRLTQQVNNPKYWPTPTAHNAKECNAKSESGRNTPTLAAQAGGKLNPDWVGWLMAFPIGWASSKVMETRKSRSRQRQRSDSFMANNEAA